MRKIWKSRRINQMVLRKKFAALIIAHDLPFNFGEYEGFMNFMKYLNPTAIPISRNIVKADVFKIYLKEKEKLKQELASIPSKISLTFDLWTSCTTECYICLTAHFVDANWKLNSKILSFSLMPPPYTGFEFSQKILEILKDWEIEKNIFSLVLDNSSANDNVQETLKSQLASQNWLVCDGEFFHMNCFAHILNLIGQEALQVASGVLDKIRESIIYVSFSENGREKFKECIEQIGDNGVLHGLRLDIPTRWNTTYLMLTHALKYQHVFARLQLNDENYEYCPSVEEWKRGEKICEFLLPFYETINLSSSTSYAISSLYFWCVWRIQCVLLNSLREEDEAIKNMVERMMVKYEKYWDEYSLMLALGAVLDPRMKFFVLAYCYSKVDASTCDRKLEHIKKKLYMLFEKYSSRTSSNVPSATQTGSSSMPKKLKSISQGLFDELIMHNRQLAAKSGKTQLDVYLDEPNLDMNYYEDLDVLEWWKFNSCRFPDLSIMACDLLSIPIATVASESIFSIGACVFDKYKNRFISKSVEALICARIWLHGFADNDEEDVDEDIDDDNKKKLESSLIKVASNCYSPQSHDMEHDSLDGHSVNMEEDDDD